MKRTIRGTIECYGSEDATIDAALEILAHRLAKRRTDVLSAPEAVRNFLRLNFSELKVEAFWVIFLDIQHRVIAVREVAIGTLAQTSVFPREVARAVLEHQAASVILAHNHPSGVAEPSRADELLTTSIRQALQLIDARVTDHLVIGGINIISFAERGLI